MPNEHIKEIMGVKGRPDITDIKRAEKTTMVWPRQKDVRGENTKINYRLDTAGEKETRTSKKIVDGRSTSSHDNKKFRTKSMEKQRRMAFGFRKMATAVKKNGQTDFFMPDDGPCEGPKHVALLIQAIQNCYVQ